MVDIMESVWRGMLIKPWEGDGAKQLPSPDQLRKKILIKVKYTPPEKAKGDIVPESDTSEDEKESSKPNKKKKMLDALSAMGVYTRAYHFKDFHASGKISTFSLYSRLTLS